MFALFGRQFTGVTRAQFRADLDDKNWVVLLRRGDELVGFSTLRFYETTHASEAIGVVYSGDTVVKPSAWSASSALSCYWIGAVNHLRRRAGARRLYWLLIVSGYRTYRFLPLYWRRFYPRHDAAMPPPTERLLHDLAVARFGPAYDPADGVVRFEQPQVLRGELCGIPAARLGDPHVAFFAARNPGHARGDELVCLTELEADNLTPAGRRMWVKGEALFARLVQAA